MAGLRDQLLKSGLVTEKQVKKLQKDQTKALKANSHRPQQSEINTETKQAEKVQRDRELNQQRQADLAKRELDAQIRQIITTRRVKPEEGDVPYNFADQGKIKKIYLTGQMRDHLVRGLLGIVRLDGRYEFVPRETIEKINQRDSSYVVHLNAHETSPTDGEDPYAQYQVPDDLVW